MTPPPAAWTDGLVDDRDAFGRTVAPHQDHLLRLAQRQLAAEQAAGTLRASDLTPEELVGEALVQAWARRDRHAATGLSVRAWLVGLQTRALARYARQEARYTRAKAVSLNESVPAAADADAVGESLYEFRQPFDAPTYADLIPGSMPVDIEAGAGDTAALSDDELAALADAHLDPDGRTAVLLHDEFQLSLAETAQILDASLRDTADALDLARATLRVTARVARVPGRAADARDSYTGDPLPT